jgi:hypothetical protein
LFANKTVADVVDNGTVITIDGKGEFEVITEHSGTIKFRAAEGIMGEKPAINLPDFPDVYKNLMKGDYLEMTWNSIKGKRIATGLRVTKRRG